MSRLILRHANRVNKCAWGFLPSRYLQEKQDEKRWFSGSSSQEPKSFRPRRSLMSVPGSDPRKIQKATTLGSDSIVLDLEDGVAWDQKEAARALVTATLQDRSISFGSTTELCVRVNNIHSALGASDLQAIIPCDRLQAIVIPKVESAEDVVFVKRALESLGAQPRRDVRILAAIESALGVLNLREIAAVGTEKCNLDALIFASEDYCADLEAIRTNFATELLYARSHLVTVAKAYGIQAIDMVHIQFRDLDGLAEECQRGRELGFTGKQAIHPLQISTIQKHFSPSDRDIAFARDIVQNYEETTAMGQGACVVNGIVVDAPVYKWAQKILKRAESPVSERDAPA